LGYKGWNVVTRVARMNLWQGFCLTATQMRSRGVFTSYPWDIILSNHSSQHLWQWLRTPHNE
jgi:hypothetical protein